MHQAGKYLWGLGLGRYLGMVGLQAAANGYMWGLCLGGAGGYWGMYL